MDNITNITVKFLSFLFFYCFVRGVYFLTIFKEFIFLFFGKLFDFLVKFNKNKLKLK